MYQYKRFENSVITCMKKGVIAVGKHLRAFFCGIFRLFNRHYTIVLVPQNEKKVYNFQITLGAGLCATVILFGIVSVFIWYGASYKTMLATLSDKETRLAQTEASLDQLRDEVGALNKAARGFEDTLSGVFSTVKVGAAGAEQGTPTTGDLASFFDTRESASGQLREVDEIKNLTSYLAATRKPIENLGKLFESQGALLSEVPNIWPIKGGVGHISMYFGENTNPFSGRLYIHRGIDISTFRCGDAIVATADGQVVTVDYDARDFGNYVIIKHKHGFYTRYAHMQLATVHIGQHVQQGEVIGYIGNTGKTTGPHLHYEVHVGSDIVDPFKYLNRADASRVNFNGGKG
jgi:murein DD-endopeptidase MepM/ murein hydrolase activator NlpD